MGTMMTSMGTIHYDDIMVQWAGMYKCLHLRHGDLCASLLWCDVGTGCGVM